VIRLNRHDTEHLAELIRALPLAPEGWVRAAQVLPAARRGLDEIVARAEADAQYRAVVVADLESALAAQGIEPSPPILEALRERLGHS
jgi:hypothetical protein